MFSTSGSATNSDKNYFFRSYYLEEGIGYTPLEYVPADIFQTPPLWKQIRYIDPQDAFERRCRDFGECYFCREPVTTVSNQISSNMLAMFFIVLLLRAWTWFARFVRELIVVVSVARWYFGDPEDAGDQSFGGSFVRGNVPNGVEEGANGVDVINGVEEGTPPSSSAPKNAAVAEGAAPRPPPTSNGAPAVDVGTAGATSSSDAPVDYTGPRPGAANKETSNTRTSNVTFASPRVPPHQRKEPTGTKWVQREVKAVFASVKTVARYHLGSAALGTTLFFWLSLMPRMWIVWFLRKLDQWRDGRLKRTGAFMMPAHEESFFLYVNPLSLILVAVCGYDIKDAAIVLEELIHRHEVVCGALFTTSNMLARSGARNIMWVCFFIAFLAFPPKFDTNFEDEVHSDFGLHNKNFYHNQFVFSGRGEILVFLRQWRFRINQILSLWTSIFQIRRTIRDLDPRPPMTRPPQAQVLLFVPNVFAIIWATFLSWLLAVRSMEILR